MLKPLQVGIQTYLALSYVQLTKLRPNQDEQYWRNGAIADTALVLFLGPTSSWILPAIFGHTFGPGRIALGVSFAAACGVAVYLSIWAARSPLWKCIANAELTNPRNNDRLWIVRGSSLLMWTIVNPLLWAIVYDARLI